MAFRYIMNETLKLINPRTAISCEFARACDNAAEIRRRVSRTQSGRDDDDIRDKRKIHTGHEEGGTQNERNRCDEWWQSFFFFFTRTDSRFNHIIHKHAVKRNRRFSLIFFILSLSLVLSQTRHSHSFPGSSLLDMFRTYIRLIARASSPRYVIGSRITAKNRSRFSSSSFFSRAVSYLSFFLFFFSFSLSLSHFSTFSHAFISTHLSRSSTLRDLLRSLYLTMIYLHVTYTSICQLVGSPFLARLRFFFLLHSSIGRERDDGVGAQSAFYMLLRREAFRVLLSHTVWKRLLNIGWLLEKKKEKKKKRQKKLIYSFTSPTLHTSCASGTFLC